MKQIGKDEGIGGFYKGIGPAWVREAVEKSFRLGLYHPIKVLIGADGPSGSMFMKFISGAMSGGFGAFVGNPFDVVRLKTMANQGQNRKISSLINEIW